MSNVIPRLKGLSYETRLNKCGQIPFESIAIDLIELFKMLNIIISSEGETRTRSHNFKLFLSVLVMESTAPILRAVISELYELKWRKFPTSNGINGVYQVLEFCLSVCII